MPSRRSQSYSLVKNSKHEEMARKREERIQRAAIQRQKKMDSYLAEDTNFSNFASQLGKMGLQLRDIPGDGNCLFRALGDQLEGHCRNHQKHRLNVVQYMHEHRKDFEPFVEDDIPFERHLQMLKKPGTFGGNDSLVAFARLYSVNIVIHQLNSPVWQIHGSENKNSRELHITYHNGEHYSSVRKLGDNTESPANIKLKIPNDNEKQEGVSQNGFSPYEEVDEAYPDPMEGMARIVRDVTDVERHVMSVTGCNDSILVRESLEDNHYDVDLTIDFILRLTVKSSYSNKSSPSSSLHETASVSSHRTNDSGIWSDNGTGSRLFGRQDSSNSDADKLGQHKSSRSSISSGYDSCNGAKPKYNSVQQQQLTNKKRKEIAKKEKKKRAEARLRQKISGRTVVQDESDDDTVVISRDLGMLKV